MSLESQLTRLEEEYAMALDEGDREAAESLREELRHLEKELAERERWQEEGQERGWY